MKLTKKQELRVEQVEKKLVKENRELRAEVNRLTRRLGRLQKKNGKLVNEQETERADESSPEPRAEVQVPSPVAANVVRLCAGCGGEPKTLTLPSGKQILGCPKCRTRF